MPIELSGAIGPKADTVNGTYTSTEEKLNGKTVYSKRGDDSKCLYFANDKRWWVANSADKKAEKIAGFAQTEAGLSHPTLAKAWRLIEGDEFQPQPVMALVMVSVVCVGLVGVLYTLRYYLRKFSIARMTNL